jgi:hypothetical protein
VVGESGRKEQGLLRSMELFLEILVDFWSVWSDLGPICKYFSEAMDLAVKFPKFGDRDKRYNEYRGARCKFPRI